MISAVLLILVAFVWSRRDSRCDRQFLQRLAGPRKSNSSQLRFYRHRFWDCDTFPAFYLADSGGGLMTPSWPGPDYSVSTVWKRDQPASDASNLKYLLS